MQSNMWIDIQSQACLWDSLFVGYLRVLSTANKIHRRIMIVENTRIEMADFPPIIRIFVSGMIPHKPICFTAKVNHHRNAAVARFVFRLYKLKFRKEPHRFDHPVGISMNGTDNANINRLCFHYALSCRSRVSIHRVILLRSSLASEHTTGII